MDKEEVKISFNGCDRLNWLSIIVDRINDTKFDVSGKKVRLEMLDGVRLRKFEPFHIVSLCCFLEYLAKSNCVETTLYIHDTKIVKLLNDLNIDKYLCPFSSAHESSSDTTIDLWKIVDNKTYEYSMSVEKYFQYNYFNDYDTSGLICALNEVYVNVSDHSQSKGNAFSYISYNIKEEKISIAACDFGLGIPTTLRNACKKEYKTDSDILKDSIKIGVTAGSTKGNKGMGLDNILSTISIEDKFRIISNKSLLTCLGDKNNIKTYPLNFDFKGTLIYFEISTKSFPLKDIEDDIIIL